MAAQYAGSHQSLRSARLPDGRVLVLDGPADSTGIPSASGAAEIYDPRSNTFNPTGSLLPGGVGEALAPLKDGRVLVTGAFPESTGEVYDPSSGQFSLAGRMVDAHRADTSEFDIVPYTATTLGDGRVLIAGGVHYQPNANVDQTFLRTAELYTPASGKFTLTGSMIRARENATATLLPNGRVLIAGGDEDNRDLEYLASAEIYDPATGKFSLTGSMSTPRSEATATLLTDGRVLIVGGVNADTDGLASAEIYDPATGKFSSTGSMATGRSQHVACLLNNGSVLIAAGNDDSNPSVPLNTAEIYDPATGRFSSTAPMLIQYPSSTSCTTLEDGRVLLVGDSLSDAELYWP
jgi:Galactose oxidase, central domain